MKNRAGVQKQPQSRQSRLEKIDLWALVAAGGLAAGLELLVVWQLTGSMDVVNYHVLAFLAVGYIIDQRRPVPGRLSWVAVTLGALLLGSALCKCLFILKGDDYRHFLALTFTLGLGWVALGFRQTFLFWKVLVILGGISIFDIPFTSAILGPLHLNDFGATLSANLLLMVGYPAVARGDQVILSGGSVEVFGPCSAAVPILYLLKLTVLVLLVFRSKPWQKIAIVGLAIFEALSLNAIRISVMAVLSAAGDHSRFAYWHQGAGSNLFSILYAAMFCAGCALFFRTADHAIKGESPL